MNLNATVAMRQGAPNGTDIVLIGPASPSTALSDQAISLESDMRHFIGMVGLSGEERPGRVESFLGNTVRITNIAKAWSYTAGTAASKLFPQDCIISTLTTFYSQSAREFNSRRL
jgi:hypothetical protein